MKLERQRRQQVAGAEQHPSQQGQPGRPGPRQQQPPGCGSQAEEADGEAEGPCYLTVRPKVGVAERFLEEAPGVHGPEADHQQRADDRNQPAVERLFHRSSPLRVPGRIPSRQKGDVPGQG